MPEKVHKAADVYGIGRELPLNYVVRKHVDNIFVENLTRDKHVVVYGSSKQGKTSTIPSFFSCVSRTRYDSAFGDSFHSGWRPAHSAGLRRNRADSRNNRLRR